jgi:hypothetical protein
MKAKKILSLATATTMLLTCSMGAFAETTTGSSIVEYDNSEEVVLESVIAPTIPEHTFDLTLDPEGLLHTYDAEKYAEGTAYFAKITTTAKVDVTKTVGDTDEKVWTVSKTEKASGLDSIVTGVTLTDDKVTAVTGIDDSTKYYVWTPSQTNDEYDGFGKFTEITTGNALTYFDITASNASTITAVTIKTAHQAYPCVCDGKVYQDTWVEVTGQATEYDASIKYYKNDKKTEWGDDLVLLDPVITYGADTNALTVKVKSTTAKTLSATVNLTNAEGLTMNDSDEFEEDDTAASVYVAIKEVKDSSPTIVALSKESEEAATATGTFSFDFDATEVNPIKWMGAAESNTATGGHNYYQYENYGIEPGAVSFYVTAIANSNEGSAEAWKTYGEGVTATTRPNLTFTWSVEDAVTVKVSQDGLVTVSSLTADKNLPNYHALSITTAAGETYWLDDDAAGAWGIDAWSATEGGTVTKQISAGWWTPVKGTTVTITAHLKDGTTVSVTEDIAE